MSGLTTVLMAVGILVAVCVVLYALKGPDRDQEGSSEPPPRYDRDPPGANPYS